MLIEDPLFVKEIEIGRLRPFHKPAPPGKDPAPPHRQGDGDEETEGGARLPAVQPGQGHAAQGGHGVGPHAADRDGISLPPPFRPQLPKAAEGSFYILGGGHAADNALPPGQGGGDEQPVGLRLGGGRGDRAL